ncbi:MAG TPA: BatA domain-containing protein, partial [Planctomycetota bacterium]|nr:BatA domain-containing protein [Planctomycetota bacterium]
MFGAPWWLLGTLAGAGPIIIHLLNRQRFKRVMWAAMEWLLKALERNRRRMRVENLILLLVRVLVLVLLALALARPVLDARGALAVAGGSRLARFFVLDNSYSMGVKGEAGTPFDRAKKAVGEMLDAATGGDLAALVVTGGESAEIIPEPTTALGDLRERLSTTELSHTDADLRAVLTRVARRVEKLEQPRVMIYVLTDLQRRNWLADAPDDGELARTLEKIRKTTGVFVVDCAGTDAGNTAVTRLVVSADETGESQGLVAVNVPVTVRATLEHFGPEPRGDVDVKMLIDGHVEKTVRVPLGAREPVAAQFPNVKFDRAGPHVVRVEADGDNLTLDDTRELAVDVDETVKVLCVNGSPSADVVANETYFLERALAPQEFE